MSIDLMATTVSLTAPATTDGRGGVAVLNDTTSGDFVGYLFDASGFDGPGVRVSQDDIAEGDGAVFGSFYHGPRSFTLEVVLSRAATPALSFARRDKLYRAVNAMRGDGTLAWTETGGSTRQITFRREQPPRGPDKDGHVLIAGVAADPRIYAGGAESTTTASTSYTLSNAGNVGTSPRFTVTSPSASISFTNNTTSETLAITGLDGSGTLTVDFLNRTVTRGGVDKYGKVTFPATWWELVPGANSISITDAATPFFRSAWI